MDYLLAYDLGTGGIKAALYDARGASQASVFAPYETRYPKPNYHEQRPMDWWEAVCKTTRQLLAQTGVEARAVRAVALSGHSQVMAPLDAQGNLLLEWVPIWSDTRAEVQAREYFRHVEYDAWYAATGDGDPPACYTLFKILWLKANLPDAYAKTVKVLGSKDYINYKLTGHIATDPSYASGFGVYDLARWAYAPQYAQAADIPMAIFPDILPSHGIVGQVTQDAARETGLAAGTLVACGGVDNSCMALGALGSEEGKAYISLGSSSWIAVNCPHHLVDTKLLPFSQAHIQEGLYTSAMSIFAAGSAYSWARRELCRDLAGEDVFDYMNAMAAEVPIGSHGVLFNPTLAGGSTQEPSVHLKGAFTGLTLGNTREDMVHAVLEGVTMNLKLLLDEMEGQTAFSGDIVLCGGGSKSVLWRQMFADIFRRDIRKTNVDQDAAALGAAAIAARACGLWVDYSRIPNIHVTQSIARPEAENAGAYEALLKDFVLFRAHLAQMEDCRAENQV